MVTHGCHNVPWLGGAVWALYLCYVLFICRLIMVTHACHNVPCLGGVVCSLYLHYVLFICRLNMVTHACQVPCPDGVALALCPHTVLLSMTALEALCQPPQSSREGEWCFFSAQLVTTLAWWNGIPSNSIYKYIICQKYIMFIGLVSGQEWLKLNQYIRSYWYSKNVCNWNKRLSSQTEVLW